MPSADETATNAHDSGVDDSVLDSEREVLQCLAATPSSATTNPVVDYGKFCAALTDLTTNLAWADKGLRFLDANFHATMSEIRNPALGQLIIETYQKLGLPTARAATLAIEAESLLRTHGQKISWGRRRSGLHVASAVGSLRGQVCTLADLAKAEEKDLPEARPGGTKWDGTRGPAWNYARMAYPAARDGLLATALYISSTNVNDIKPNWIAAALASEHLIQICAYEVVLVLQQAIQFVPHGFPPISL